MITDLLGYWRLRSEIVPLTSLKFNMIMIMIRIIIIEYDNDYRLVGGLESE